MNKSGCNHKRVRALPFMVFNDDKNDIIKSAKIILFGFIVFVLPLMSR